LARQAQAKEIIVTHLEYGLGVRSSHPDPEAYLGEFLNALKAGNRTEMRHGL